MARGWAQLRSIVTAELTPIRSSRWFDLENGAAHRDHAARRPGKFSLDDLINDRLPPSLRIPDDGFHKPILVRHLITHSAGFETLIEGLFVHDPEKLLPLDASLVDRRIHRVREPGTLAIYSSYGSELAGALVAHIAGEPWQDYAERRSLRTIGIATDRSRTLFPNASRRRSAYVSQCRLKSSPRRRTGSPGRGAPTMLSSSNTYPIRIGRLHVRGQRHGRLYSGRARSDAWPRRATSRPRRPLR